ncbi:MAG: TonB-dependent receptor [Bacteroidia bacterium]|nr:TonB-dependent receptor [Bacteroidia bacterium]
MNKKITVLILLSASLLFPFLLSAQTGIIRGFVYEKENGEPMMFTNVYLKGTTIGASTDVNGYFNISRIPVGNYTMMVTTVGYDTIQVPVTVKAGAITTQKLYAVKANIALKELVVSAEKQDAVADVRMSVVKVTPKQIKQVPTIGGEPDFAQYVQVLPGVIFTGDQGGQLYIRGGSPIQNKVLLDGMTVYNPFHSIGLFSVFDSDIIRNADIYTGGFNADYGGRISSIMDITMKDGNKNRFSGKLSATTFGSKLLLEGPIKKYSDDSKTNISFVFSGKTSYLEQSSKYLYTYIDTAGLPFNFTDLYGKITINAENGTKVSLFGFNFTDQVKYRAVSDLNWQSYGGGGNIILVPSGSNVLVKSNFSYSKYNITLKEKDALPRNSYIGGFNFGLSFLYFLGKDELNYGIETSGYTTDFNYYNSIGRLLQQKQNTTELAGYVKYKHNFGKLLFEPGFRLQYYNSLSEISPEPRLGLKYLVNDKFRIKFASGYYSQNFIAANSDRDVVNLFYGFLTGPDLSYMPSKFDGDSVNSALQTSTHFILGFEYDLTQRINVNVEGYYKINNQLTNINRNKLFDSDNYDKPDYLKKDFIVESGKAYGVDFVFKYDYKRIYFWFVYSLGYVDRYDGFPYTGETTFWNTLFGTKFSYNPHYDRRHNINLVGSYTFGKNLNWEFNVRWNLGSGFSFTQTQGYYELIPFTNGVNTNYTTANGQIGILYGDLDKGRLPYYHRLDVSLKRVFELGKNSRLEANAGITNVYNRENIFYFDRLTHEPVNQLPFMPSAGLSLTF